jgi:hypothetical protein
MLKTCSLGQKLKMRKEKKSRVWVLSSWGCQEKQGWDDKLWLRAKNCPGIKTQCKVHCSRVKRKKGHFDQTPINTLFYISIWLNERQLPFCVGKASQDVDSFSYILFLLKLAEGPRICVAINFSWLFSQSLEEPGDQQRNGLRRVTKVFPVSSSHSSHRWRACVKFAKTMYHLVSTTFWTLIVRSTGGVKNSQWLTH